jgi:hypothetical protein
VPSGATLFVRLEVRNDASRRRGPRAHRVDAVQISRPTAHAVAAFYEGPEKAGAFGCKNTGIREEAVAATVVRAEQHAAVDRFGSLY